MADKGRTVVARKAVQLERLQIEYIPAASISPNAYNPNRQSAHDFELLIRSMLEDGFTQPIVGQRQSREIIDGEHRWTGLIVVEALKREARKLHPEMSLEEALERIATPERIQQLREQRLDLLQALPDLELPVVFTDMTAEQMRIATLRHNRARGSEDIDLTAQVLRDLQQLGALDWAQDSLMLDDVELNKLLEDVPAPEALAGDEYGQAWEPDRGLTDSAEQPASVQARSFDGGPGESATAMSAAAVEAARQREAAMRAARTEEEREAVRRDIQGMYRLILMFHGEEADLVRSVLGDTPAERVLALCRQAVAGAANGGAA